MRNIKSKRIVIKIGTNTLSDKKGLLNEKVMKSMVFQIAKIKDKREIILVTSGAIGAGMKELNIKKKPKDTVMKQVCAGVGQSILMAKYHGLFRKYKIKIAQILLTHDVFKNKKTFINLRNSMNKLFKLGVVAIINENDPISIDEIGPSFPAVGDNDHMSALIATKLKADALIILTNVEGLYDKDPANKSAVLVREVRKIDKKIERMCGSMSSLGTGGMKSKVQAAKETTKAGITVVIANGRGTNVLPRIINNEDVGTIFHSGR
jgi:glutamate 5-kinase